MKKVRSTAIGLIATLGLLGITTPAMAESDTTEYKDKVGKVWISSQIETNVSSPQSLFGNGVRIVSTDPYIAPQGSLQDLTKLQPPADWQNITVENNGEDTDLNLAGIFHITDETNDAITRVLPTRAYLLNHYKWAVGNALLDIPQHIMIKLHFELDRYTSFNGTDLSVPEELTFEFTSDKFNVCNDGESLKDCLKREGAVNGDDLVDPVDAANEEHGTALTHEVRVKPKLENGKVIIDLMGHLSMAKLQKLNPQYGKYDGNKNWDFNDPNGPEQNPTFNPGSPYISAKPKTPFKILGKYQNRPHYEYSGYVKYDNTEAQEKLKALMKQLNPLAGSDAPSPEQVKNAFGLYQSLHNGSIPFFGKRDLFMKDGKAGGPWADAYTTLYNGFADIYGTGYNNEVLNAVDPLRISFQGLSTQALAYSMETDNKATGNEIPSNVATNNNDSSEGTPTKSTGKIVSDLDKFNGADCTGTVYKLTNENSSENITGNSATCKEAFFAFTNEDKEAAVKAASLGKTLFTRGGESVLKEARVQDVVALRGLDKSKKYLLVSKLVDQDGNEVKEVLTPIENLDFGQKIVGVAIPAKTLQNKQLKKLIFLTYLYEGEEIREDKLLLKSENLDNAAETIEVTPLPEEPPAPPAPNPNPNPEPNPGPVPNPNPEPNPGPVPNPNPQPSNPQPNQATPNSPARIDASLPKVLEETGSTAEEVLVLAILALVGGGIALVIAKRKA